MARTTKKKFLIIDPSQTTEFSHNYQYNRIMARQARDAGYDVTLMTHQKDVSNFSDLGVKVERAFPHSLYDYDGTHDYWRSVFWRRFFTARYYFRDRFVEQKNRAFFQTFPDTLNFIQFVLRCIIVLFSPFIYLFDFVQSRIIYKQKPFNRDIFADILAKKFKQLRLSDGDHVVMHSTTFGALESFLSIRAISRLKAPYQATFTSIFHHSLDEEEASRSWYLEYYQRSNSRSLKRRWEIGSPFKTSRFLALTPELVDQLAGATGLTFEHFHHICDKGDLLKADQLDVAVPSGDDFLIGIRTQDVTSRNLDQLRMSLAEFKDGNANTKLCLLNRGSVVTSRTASQLGSVFGGFDVIDTTDGTAFLAAFKQIDVLILPYVASEYSHRVSAILYEASAFGLPVIVPSLTTLASEIGNLKVHAFASGHELTLRLQKVASQHVADRILRQDKLRIHPIRDVLLRNVVEQNLRSQNGAINVNSFGPIAALVTPFWGRCGSTTVFDSETEYLLDRGYYLGQFMVSQQRFLGNSTKYVFDVLRENAGRTRPHVYLLSNPTRRRLIWLRLSKAFHRKSALGQDVMRLGKVTEQNPGLSQYFFDEATIAVVNHSFHGDYLKRFKRAKIVLETQDIQALQYQIRNETNRMSGRPETYEQWLTDEIDVWKQVDSCVNLSPEEQDAIKQYQPNSHFIKPWIAEREPVATRSWPQFCLDNQIHESVGHVMSFDFLLWGDYHPANISSTRWFIEQALLPQHFPASNTLIVGRVGHQMYNIFGSINQLYLGGFVDSIDDAVLRSKLLILPDQAGSGISIKTMDALALQRPFVATSLALRSLNLGDGRFKGCETLEEFIADCRLLLKSEKARKERVKIAKYLYDLNFSRAQYYRKWDNVLSSVGIEVQTDGLNPTGGDMPEQLVLDAAISDSINPDAVKPDVVKADTVIKKVVTSKTAAANNVEKKAVKKVSKKVAA